jgi:hypothetical protein
MLTTTIILKASGTEIIDYQRVSLEPEEVSMAEEGVDELRELVRTTMQNGKNGYLDIGPNLVSLGEVAVFKCVLSALDTSGEDTDTLIRKTVEGRI